MKEYFYVNRKGELKEIPGRVYRVSLPIALDLPCLSKPEHELIVHKSISLLNSSYKWTVTHAATGKSIVKGPTKKTQWLMHKQYCSCVAKKNSYLVRKTADE